MVGPKQGQAEAPKHIAAQKQTVAVVLLAIVLLFLVLRIPNIHHTVNWDEAQDSLAVYEHVEYPTQFWGGRFFSHPPIYLGTGILFGKIVHPDKRQTVLFLETFSLLASLGVLILLYFIGKDWFDRKTGLLAAFFYSILPASKVFDTWVKQDAVMLFFVLLFLLFFFRKKWVLSGIFLGLALLSKEPAVFIPFVAGAYLLVEKRFKDIGRLVEASVIGGLMSFWWYFWYSGSKGQFLDFFTGRGPEATAFKAPWYWLIARIPFQSGWLILILCLVAVGFFVVRFRFEKKGMVPFLILWMVLLYALFSISYGKPVWIITITLPPTALLAGWGLAQVWKKVDERRDTVVGVATVAVVMGLALILSLMVPFATYMKQVDKPYYQSWETERKLADELNLIKPTTLVMSIDDVEPVLFFYTNSYEYSELGFVGVGSPEDFNGGAANGGGGKIIVLLDSNFTNAEFLKRLAIINPAFVMVRKNPGQLTMTTNLNRTSLIETLKQGHNWLRVGKAYVFQYRTP